MKNEINPIQNKPGRSTDPMAKRMQASGEIHEADESDDLELGGLHGLYSGQNPMAPAPGIRKEFVLFDMAR